MFRNRRYSVLRLMPYVVICVDPKTQELSSQIRILGTLIQSYYLKQPFKVVNLVLFVSDQRKTQQTALLAAKKIIPGEKFRESPLSKLIYLIQGLTLPK